ncbi:hypothetical protein Poly21_48320 [Allorhodopirellula heiligendammensis]|uniref:Uncharacterized protein n=1 Tax=Allorhodopirellula heiligendammensis TaxID=2714739 RepID=A0A5C6BHX8_9BACT|nr:hypothetical protein Poly21_48320 [Allorhodopirellula heiligendammensis]
MLLRISLRIIFGSVIKIKGATSIFVKKANRISSSDVARACPLHAKVRAAILH